MLPCSDYGGYYYDDDVMYMMEAAPGMYFDGAPAMAESEDEVVEESNSGSTRKRQLFPETWLWELASRYRIMASK